jgi:hypothetical protein
MTKILNSLLFSSFLFLVACSGNDCDQLPKKFSSYDEAVKTIKAAHFKVEESVNTSKSSWLRGAAFYSCDGATGFFILKTDNQDYLYSGVPSEIWEGFKNAESFGSYYDHNIKHKYSFNLNQ